MRKGWFWCCPILWDNETKVLAPRHWIFYWLLEFMIFNHNSMLIMADFLSVDIERSYPIRLNKIKDKK